MNLAPEPLSSLITVVYIAGAGRSGSTIIDNILGQVPGFASVGEFRFVWERGVLEGRRCGCGEPFGSCPTWSAIMLDAFGDRDLTELAKRMVELQKAGLRARRLPRLLRHDARIRLAQEMQEYLSNTAALYAAAQRHFGCRVLVDSSKLPPYGSLLDLIPGIDVRIVHLIRDPRATGYSWLRKRALPDRDGTHYMQRQGPVKASALWALWNTAASRLWRNASGRYLRVHYERFVNEPRQVIDEIVAHAGDGGTNATAEDGGPVPAPFVSDREVDLAPTHSVAGNPSRFSTGRVTIRADDEWKAKMRAWDRIRVVAVTWPILPRYGYSLRVPR